MLFMAVLCVMGAATDSEIDIDCIRSKALSLVKWEEAKADEFIAYCTERNLIHVGSKPYLRANRRILADQESMAEKQEKWRGQKQKQRGQSADKSETSGGPVNTEDLKNEDLNTEHLKTEDLKDVTVPQSWEAEGREHLQIWSAHMRAMGKTLEFTSLQAIISTWNHDIPEFIRRVKHSVSSGYKALYPPPDTRDGPGKVRAGKLDRELKRIAEA